MTDSHLNSRHLHDGNRRRRIEYPFYAVTWQQALQDFQDGILTPRGLIYCYFVVNLRPGSEKEIDVAELCSFLKIHEATYYRAIGALKGRGRLNIRRGKMTVGVPEIHTLSGFSQSCEFDSQSCELTSQDCELTSQTCENRNDLKPSDGGDSRNFANVPNRSKKFKETNSLGTVPPTRPVSEPESINSEDTGTNATDPLTAEVESLCSKIEAAGVRPNKTIQETIASLLLSESSAAARLVENAVSALREQQTKGKVRNPGGFFIAALRRSFTANQAKVEARVRHQEPKPEIEVYGFPVEPVSLNQIAMSVDQALLGGDRGFALAKLQQLWAEGWHDQLEELMQLRRDWGFSLTQRGISDASS